MRRLLLILCRLLLCILRLACCRFALSAQRLPASSSHRFRAAIVSDSADPGGLRGSIFVSCQLNFLSAFKGGKGAHEHFFASSDFHERYFRCDLRAKPKHSTSIQQSLRTQGACHLETRKEVIVRDNPTVPDTHSLQTLSRRCST